jgi:hypothetical protein
MAVSVDFCAASSHAGGRPFGGATRFLMQAKQKKPCAGSGNRKPDAWNKAAVSELGNKPPRGPRPLSPDTPPPGRPKEPPRLPLGKEPPRLPLVVRSLELLARLIRWVRKLSQYLPSALTSDPQHAVRLTCARQAAACGNGT